MADPSGNRYLRSLPGLKKLRSLRDVEESPLHTRFNQALVSKWAPLLSSLVAQYSIPGRLDSADLRQELIQSIWKLTTRMDPVSRPTDFDRMCRTELRNKCVDLNRHAKARKRMGRTGHALQCGVCGGVGKLSLGEPIVCKYCGEESDLRRVETYSKDVSFVDQESADSEKGLYNAESGKTSHAVCSSDPADSLIVAEMIQSIKDQLDGKDLDVFREMVSPSTEFLKLLLDNGYTGDHRQAPLSLHSKYHGIPERDVSARLKRIKILVAKLCGDSVSASSITRATSRQGR